MAKVSEKYETVFVINSSLTDEEIASNVAKFKELIEQNGTIDKIDEWGKRRFAYPINDMTEGYYVLIDFTSKPSFTAELDRVYKITDSILRSLITKVEE